MIDIELVITITAKSKDTVKSLPEIIIPQEYKNYNVKMNMSFKEEKPFKIYWNEIESLYKKTEGCVIQGDYGTEIKPNETL